MMSIFDSAEFNANLFFPRPDRSSAPPGAREIYVEVEDSIKVHARRYPSPTAKFSLLYFHGNGEIVSDYDDMEGPFAELGAELIVCDYRGYGKSGGSPSLRTALSDARTVYGALRDSKTLLPRVCVMGRSLGSASAIELCAHFKDIDACVIESGYADPIPLVERRGMKIQATTPEEDAAFNNAKKIARVTCPLLVMHGEEDWLISSREAELNYRQAGSRMKILEILPGVGHNDIIMAEDNAYFNCLRTFFDKIFNSGGC